MPDKNTDEKTKGATIVTPAPIGVGLAWPFNHIFTMIGLGDPQDTELELKPCLAFSDLAGHVGGMTNAIRGFALAYFTIYYIHGGHDGY